ncbi:MAG: FAD:protein FMN transferase [Syntrophothermus sp.]
MSGESHRAFACFGGTVAVHVRGATAADGEAGAELAEQRLLAAHRRLSRFEPESELSRLNRDPREAVPATPLLRALAAAVRRAGALSEGLVDATMVAEIERAGYRESLGAAGGTLSLAEALAAAPPRHACAPSPAARWQAVAVDEQRGVVIRPPGVAIDSGGLAKGLLADLLADELGGRPAFGIDCCGDVRVGGREGLARRILVEDPFGGPPLHELTLRDGAAATSGIGRRCWRRAGGRPAHHLLDPATGEPAFTGIVQATALAPFALLAEIYAKTALLAGPEAAPELLPQGGVLVHDDGTAEVVEARVPIAAGVQR